MIQEVIFKGLWSFRALPSVAVASIPVSGRGHILQSRTPGVEGDMAVNTHGPNGSLDEDIPSVSPVSVMAW